MIIEKIETKTSSIKLFIQFGYVFFVRAYLRIFFLDDFCLSLCLFVYFISTYFCLSVPVFLRYLSVFYRTNVRKSSWVHDLCLFVCFTLSPCLFLCLLILLEDFCLSLSAVCLSLLCFLYVYVFVCFLSYCLFFI